MDNSNLINIERAVLSSIIFDQDVIEDVLGILKPKDFYLPAHQKIFAVMERLSYEDLPIDEQFLKKYLPSDFDESVIIDIISTNPISNTLAYAKEIKDASVKRELINLANKIKKVTIEEDLNAVEAVDLVQNELYQITTDSASSELKNIENIIFDTLDLMEKMKQRGNQYLIGQTTGFDSLDKKTTGFNEGDLVIIAARPAMGKTSLVLNTTLQNILKDDGVIFFSLEMPAEQLMMRMLSIYTSISLQKIRKGDLNDEEWSAVNKAFEVLKNKKFFVDDSGSVNINQLRARVRKIASNPENKIKMVIIDYLQLMQGSSAKDRHLEVSEISRGLKMLARELKIPIIALSQLNRSLESRADKRPMLSDIRESGSIEQDADIIMFVYRDDVYKEREEKRKEKEAKEQGKEYTSTYIEKEVEDVEIIIGKQRNGPVGTVKLKFHKALTKFFDPNSSNINAPLSVTQYSMDTTQESNIDLLVENIENSDDVDMPDVPF